METTGGSCFMGFDMPLRHDASCVCAMNTAQSEVRSALAAYTDGLTPLPVFEQSVARLLAGRTAIRMIVHTELSAAVADGTLPPESLHRLGLVSAPVAPVPDNHTPEPPNKSNRPRARRAPRSDDGAKLRGRRHSTPLDSPDTASDWRDNRRSTPQIPQCGGLLGNRYRLERLLGEGGMGMVFLAIDQEVRGEMFAIKVLRPEVRDNLEFLRLLREEVRRTRALRHPNIVGVYSLNSDPSGVYMLMEYLEGKSLKTVLDEEFGRGMPLIKAWPVIHDIGAALAYAHDHNVIHSDIKPSNVVITSSGSCKLLDFGIARADRNRTITPAATQIGALTPAYACCEMFEGRAPDQSDDVYAFACVVYEILTGRHPYGRVNSVDARAQKLQPPPIKGLSKRQNQGLARALEFERERRSASVEVLLEAIKGMANNARDRKAFVSSAVAIAAVAIVSTGWILDHRYFRKDLLVHQRPILESVNLDVPKTPKIKVPTSSSASDYSAAVPVAKVIPPAPVIGKSSEASLVAANKPAIVELSPSKHAGMPEIGKEVSPLVPAVLGGAKEPKVAVAVPTAIKERNPQLNDLPHSDGSAELSVDTLVTRSNLIVAKNLMDQPPLGKKLPSIFATAESQANMQSDDNCPYPPKARKEVQTGTVVMLVYVSADGSPTSTQLDAEGSSGSPELDDAAINCVKEMGHFPAKLVGSKPVAYWARTRFLWSFGG